MIVYTVLLIRERARALDGAALLRELRAVPGTIRGGVRLAVSNRALLLLLTILALVLFATGPVEVLWPTVVQAMLQPERAAAVVGLLTAGYFLAIAVGAGLAGRASRLLGGRHAIVLAAVLGALVPCQIALARQETFAGFTLAFLLFSVVLGLSEPPAASISSEERKSTSLGGRPDFRITPIRAVRGCKETSGSTRGRTSAILASRSHDCPNSRRTVVRSKAIQAASGMSSKPATATRRGTFRPARRRPSIIP